MIAAIFLHISYSSVISVNALQKHICIQCTLTQILQIPVAHDNVLLIALPLNYVISPCQADNLSSHNVDMLMVTTTIQYNGSFDSHYSTSIMIKC